MGSTSETRVVRIKDVWYLETLTGFEGPFDSAEEANTYLGLTRSADAARLEFAGLAFSPGD